MELPISILYKYMSFLQVFFKNVFLEYNSHLLWTEDVLLACISNEFQADREE